MKQLELTLKLLQSKLVVFKGYSQCSNVFKRSLKMKVPNYSGVVLLTYIKHTEAATGGVL